MALRLPTQYESHIFEETMHEWSQMQIPRSIFAPHWEEISEILLPDYRNTFFPNSYNPPGMKKTQQQVDSTGQVSLSRFSAIVDSLLTPANMIWHGLEATDPKVNADRKVKLWFQNATRELFSERISPHANFIGQNYAGWQCLGAFGTTGMMIDHFADPLRAQKGIRYMDVPIGELYLAENAQHMVDRFIRHFRLTARQAKQMFGDRIPPQLEAAIEAKSEMPYNFLHRVCLREDYDPGSWDAKGKPWASYYISIEGHCLLEEGGYHTFPMAIGRYVQTPGEVYGRSPAMEVLPALKTLNNEKRTFLKQGHRAADPVILTADDGMLSIDLRPGGINKGGVSADGKLLVNVLPTGQIQTTLEMMQEEQNLIKDVFLVSLFQILEETPQMTATEVIERVNEKGILLAPTVGRQMAERLGPQIDRELDILMQQGRLPPMPPLLREAGGQYKIKYTSPLARAARAQEAAAFMRSVEDALAHAQATGDPSRLDLFNFDVADYEIATDIRGVPETWMNTKQAIAGQRKGRSQSQQQKMQVEALPAQAAMMKAQSVVAKNTGQIQQQPGQSPAAIPVRSGGGM